MKHKNGTWLVCRFWHFIPFLPFSFFFLLLAMLRVPYCAVLSGVARGPMSIKPFLVFMPLIAQEYQQELRMFRFLFSSAIYLQVE